MSGNCHSVDKSGRGGILDAAVEGHNVGMMVAKDLGALDRIEKISLFVRPRIEIMQGLPRDVQTFRLRSISGVPGL